MDGHPGLLPASHRGRGPDRIPPTGRLTVYPSELGFTPDQRAGAKAARSQPNRHDHPWNFWVVDLDVTGQRGPELALRSSRRTPVSPIIRSTHGVKCRAARGLAASEADAQRAPARWPADRWRTTG